MIITWISNLLNVQMNCTIMNASGTDRPVDQFIVGTN